MTPTMAHALEAANGLKLTLDRSDLVVRFDFVGFHRWPDAPAHRNYLASRHRHIFKVEVTIPAYHADREVEFHDLIDAARGLVPADGDLGSLSCEALAFQMATAVAKQYERPAQVAVFEDDECGGIVAVGIER